MQSDKQPIRQEWRRFEQQMIRRDAPEPLVDAMRVAFYAGAAGMLNQQADRMRSGRAQDVLDFFTVVREEIIDFARSDCDRIGCGCHREHRGR